MVNRILSLLDENKVTAKQLATDTGLAQSSVTDWKKGRSKPSAEAIIKIAEYFGVTTDYILTGKESNQSTTVTQELTENEKEILALLNQFDERTQLKFLGRVEALAKEMIADAAPEVRKSAN